MRTWFITGAGRGLGKAIVEAALAHGDNVVATGRDPSRITRCPPRPDQLLSLSLDVTDPDQGKRAVADAEAQFGGIDILVNNAGYAQIGAFEEIPAADVERQFATNLFGALHVTRAVLPIMRRAQRGHILNISSIAGLRGGVYSTVYSASKFAIEGFSEALSHEVAPLGIRVTIIEPGAFRTDFFDPTSIRHGSTAITDYAELTAKVSRGVALSNHRQIGDPKRLASILIDLVALEDPPLRLLLGSDAFTAAQEKVARLKRELNAWRHLSLSTDFEAKERMHT